MVTRVIAFVNDKSEYKSELKDLKEAALKSAERNDLRVARVTSSSLVKYYKKKMGREWFEELSSNSIVLLRNTEGLQDAQYYNLDIDTMPIFNFINKASLPPVPTLNAFSQRIHKILNFPLFIAFVDFEDIHTADQSRDLVKNLKTIESAFPTVVLARIEKTDNEQKKIEMGITWSDLPSFAYSNSGFGDQCAFPPTYPMTQKNLQHFIRSCTMGKFENEVVLPDTYENIK